MPRRPAACARSTRAASPARGKYTSSRRTLLVVVEAGGMSGPHAVHRGHLERGRGRRQPDEHGCRRQPRAPITRRRNGIPALRQGQLEHAAREPVDLQTSSRRRPAGGRAPAGARAGSGGRRNAGVRAPGRREASEHCTIPFAMNPSRASSAAGAASSSRRCVPARPGARARRRLPARARRAHARARPLRRPRAARVRRPRPRRSPPTRASSRSCAAAGCRWPA